MEMDAWWFVSAESWSRFYYSVPGNNTKINQYLEFHLDYRWTYIYFQVLVIVLSHRMFSPRVTTELPVLEAGSHLPLIFPLAPPLHLHQFPSILAH